MAEQLADVFDVQIQFPLDLRIVKPDVNGRDAIGTLQRYEGLPVWTVSEQKLWRLVGGITNDDWVDQTPTNSGVQSVTVGTSVPTGGNNGDIYFRNVSGGTEVYYNNAGTWGSVGTIPTGGASYTPDPSLPNPPTLAYLNSNYPAANIGDIVYREGATQIIEATCYAAGKWNWIMKNRGQ